MQGKVFVQFVVNEDSEIINEIAVKGINDQLDAEAVRIMKLSENWIQGRISKNGPVAKFRMVLPITFRLPIKEEIEKKAKREEKLQKRAQYPL